MGQPRWCISSGETKTGGVNLFMKPGNAILGLIRMGDASKDWRLAVCDESTGQNLLLNDGVRECRADNNGDIDALYGPQTHTAQIDVRGPTGQSLRATFPMEAGQEAIYLIGDAAPTASLPAPVPTPVPRPTPVPDEYPDFLVIEASPKGLAPRPGSAMDTTANNLSKFLYDERTNWPGAVQNLIAVADTLREFGAAEFYAMKGRGPGREGKWYLVFKGNPRTPGRFLSVRKMIRGPGPYSMKNPQIVQLGLGKTGALKAATKGTVVSFIVVGGLEVIQQLLETDPSLTKLGVKMTVDAGKIAISSAGALGFTLAALGAATLAGVTVPVWVVATGAMVVALFIGKKLDVIDDQHGISVWLQERARELEDRAMSPAAELLRQFESWIVHYSSGYGAY